MTRLLREKVRALIREIPDFPRKGILFKDIAPVLEDPVLCAEIAEYLAVPFRNDKIDVVVGIESRGFLFGMLMAQCLNCSFAMVRKVGKLPFDTIAHAYSLEYGTSEVEIHSDSIKPGQNVLVHDDLLATGGTAVAAAELTSRLKGKVAGFSFLVELSFLNGKEKLEQYNTKTYSLIEY